MLYVFHVDVGRMLSFDMTVALSSVENLKNTIERLHGIPAANIVLLVSGGEMLLHNTQVSYYSAGTDTNPIYMFLKGDVKLPSVLAPLDADLELREQVERCIELPAVYETVIKRAQIALRMYDLARDEDRMCERLVHEQHLQQQGWSAVVANLEDLTEEFHTRFQNFCVAFDSHLERRSSYLELLRSFSDDLSKLSRIPILPGLMPLAEADFHGFDDLLENDDVFSRSTNQQQSVLMVGANAAAGIEGDGEAAAAAAAKATGPTGADNIDDKSISSTSTSPNKKLKMANDPNEERVSQSSQTSINSNTTRRLNLLQWITSKENHNVLRTMSEECVQGLSTFNEDVYAKLKQEVENIIKLAKKGDVKEIRGLGERLCKLEELKYKIKNMVKDQKELSTAFQQNQNRAINLRDASILPDLCASHQSQLLVMIQNHKKIREHRHCIAKAKDELGNNLNARLGRIVYIENAMSEFDNRLLFYHRCLRRAERHIHIIEQIHQAPNMYVAAVTEVMRRNIFSTEFRLWASKLAEDFDSIHREEMKRRQQFNTNFEGHFLNILFPGMADMPPAFANENPIIFDARLPNITRSDIDVLTSHLPEMATEMHLPDMEPVIYFFVSRSGTHQRDRFEELLKQKQKRVEEELKQVSREDEQSLSSTTAMVVSGKLLINARLSELRKDSSGLAAAGDDSETDTETEFEQVPRNNQQSIATSTSEYPKISKSTATDILITRSAETLTDENSETLKKEVTRMRVMLGAMSELALECIQLARSNLLTFREEHVSLKDDLQSDLQTLNDKWNVLRMQCDAREYEVMLQQANQEKEILRLQDELKKRECELLQEKELNHHLSTMKIKCFSLEVQVDELKNKLAELENEKEQAVIDTRDKLIHEHKTEIESLRQRFKLMTSMDRSPSDLSLESIASNEHVIEKHVHDTILSELRCELENEKERAIAAAMEMERSIWQSKIFPLNSESVMANVGILKDMIEERERQLEQLREKDLILTKENYQLKTRLDALTNEEGNSWLKEKIDYLNRDKCRLEEELTHEKSKRLEMESSFAALKCSTYEQSASSRSKSTIRMPKYIALESCVRGDLVLVVWSMRHGQFVVLQDSPSLYFLHADSLPALNLRIPQAGEGSILPMPFYAIGHVLDKEYCQAKKDENRYRVNRGSRFYRIKLAPYVTRQLLRRERLETLSTSSISRSISRCQSEIGQMSDSTESSTVSGILPYLSSMTGAFQADVLDGTVASPVNVINVTANPPGEPLSAMLPFKERTMSITSVSEEDDEPVPMLSASSQYISAGDEDDNLVAASPHSTAVTDEVAAAVKQDINLQLEKTQTTVITEQPTATASKLELDLMLASADINTTTEEINSITSNTQTDSYTIATNTTTTESIGEPPEFVVSTSPKKYFSFVLKPTNREHVDDSSQDSDEFRSLEHKDDSDFPLLAEF